MAGSNIPKNQKKEILIRNTTKGPLPITQSETKRIIEEILKRLNETAGSWSISLVFTTDGQIRKLNKKYLGRDFPTDVIAFSYPDKNADLAISLERAKRNIAIYKTSLIEELTLYLIHGILHLKGYDDTNPASYKRMFNKQNEILGKLAFLRHKKAKRVVHCQTNF